MHFDNFCHIFSFPGKAVGVRIGQGAAAEAAPAVVAKVVSSTSNYLASKFIV